MKKLLLISGVFTTLILLSCGESEKEKQLEQKLITISRHDDSIKQATLKKLIAKELERDNRKLKVYNADLASAKEQLVEIERFHFLRSEATKEAEVNAQNMRIQTIQDSIDAICSRMAGKEGNGNDVIPMTVDAGGLYEIPVVINDALAISFILDSGASDVSISPDVASTLIKTGTVTASDFIGVSTYTFADGSRAMSRVFIIRKLRIGNHIITNVQAHIQESMNAPMLLGQSVQSRFGNMLIDNTTHTLRFN